jgi:hypothetical protein
MRRLGFAIAFAFAVGCGKDDVGLADTDLADVVDSEQAACATFDDYACNGAAHVCHAECLPVLKIDCNLRDCTLHGEGMGGGRSCTISVGARQEGCGLCETAWEECR